MSEVIINKYLDFGGLRKYDERIKAYIASGDDVLRGELAAAIEDLNAKIGELEGSDDKSLAEIIESIYASIAEIVEAQESLGDRATTNEGEIAGVKERVTAVEEAIKNLGEIEGGESLGEIVSEVKANSAALESLKGDADTVTAAVNKIAQDAAEDAQSAAETYAAGLNAAMDTRMTTAEGDIAALKAIDHDKLVADAVAAVVAGADSEFDTLKEVADWINNDTTGAAGLQTKVSEHTDSINTINGELDALESKVDGDIANLTTHMTEAAAKIEEVDGRLAALDAFVESHARIPDSDIEGLFGENVTE